MNFDPLDPNTWQAPPSKPSRKPTNRTRKRRGIPEWTRAEAQAHKAHEMRLLEICDLVSKTGIPPEADALLTEITEEIWADCVNDSEAHVLRIVGQVCLENGMPAMFRRIWDLTTGWLPARGDMFDWLEEVSSAGGGDYAEMLQLE